MNVHHSIGNDAKKNLHQRWIEMYSGNLQNKNINRYTQKIASVSFTIFRDRKQKKRNKIIMFCILFCLFVVLNWFIFRILVRCSCYDVPHHVFKFHSECNPNKQQQQQEPANRQLAANHFMYSIRPIQSRLFVRWLCTLYTDWALSIVVSQIFWAKQKNQFDVFIWMFVAQQPLLLHVFVFLFLLFFSFFYLGTTIFSILMPISFCALFLLDSQCLYIRLHCFDDVVVCFRLLKNNTWKCMRLVISFDAVFLCTIFFFLSIVLRFGFASATK